jgi:hypothetical protein
MLTGLHGPLPSLTSAVRQAYADVPAARFGPYLRRTDGRTADPVNVVFVGEAEAVAVALQLVDLLGWMRIPGSEMAFMDQGVMRPTELQLGTGSRGGLRKHIRLAGAGEESESWGEYTLAAVHHDITVPCGHVGAGFDEERDALAAAMERAGHPVSWLWLGNDGPVEHCDGSHTHGDGWAAVIDLRRSADAVSAAAATLSAIASRSPAGTVQTPAAMSTHALEQPRGDRAGPTD